MFLDHGDPNQIQNKHWYVIELRSETQAEETLRRIMLDMRTTFGSDPAEIFVPVERTRIHSFTLKTGVYVFIRADDPAKIAKLRKITGVAGINAKNGSNRSTAFIHVDDPYVQSLIKETMDAYYQRATRIHVGGWVKILDGQQRDYFGVVESVGNGRACVRVDMQTKQFFVDTSIYNLLDCSEIDPRHRVFFYSEPVERMIEDDPERAAQLLAPYLTYDEVKAKAWLTGEDAEHPSVPMESKTQEQGCVSRERTPSRFVRSLVQSGVKDPKQVLGRTVVAIREGHIRCPGQLNTLLNIIRQEMTVWAYPGENIHTYTEMIKAHPEADLKIRDVKDAIPELEFPVTKDRKKRTVPVTVTEVKVEACTASVPMTTASAALRVYFENGGRDVLAILARIEDGLKAGAIRAPKHLDSLVHAVKAQIFRHFRPNYPTASFRDIVEREGDTFRVGMTLVRQSLPDLEAIILSTRIKQQSAAPVAVSETTVSPVFSVKPASRRKSSIPMTVTTTKVLA